MTYELAKALKDAGFPQRRDRYDRHYIVGTDTWFTTETAKQLKKPRGSVIGFDEVLVHIPDLSELIDACGDNFVGLHRTMESGLVFTEAAIESPPQPRTTSPLLKKQSRMYGWSSEERRFSHA